MLGFAHPQLLARLAQLSFQLPNPLPVIGHGQAVAGFFKLKFQAFDLSVHLPLHCFLVRSAHDERPRPPLGVAGGDLSQRNRLVRVMTEETSIKKFDDLPPGSCVLTPSNQETI